MLGIVLVIGTAFGSVVSMADEVTHPLSAEERDAINRRLDALIESSTRGLAERPDDVRLLLSRGAAYFQRHRFKESLADFDRIIAIEPKHEPELWQRGITLYCLKEYDAGARQFERYHTFDCVDRENGIWHFLCRAASDGPESARKSLLVYTADDRPPFPELYRMFQGKLTGAELLEMVKTALVSADERDKMFFYGHLYVGYHALAHKDKKTAITHLREAVANRWGRRSGNGAGYMWHVARVQFELLLAETKPARADP